VIFSAPAQHALRALLCLSAHEGRGPVLVREIAATVAVPKPYLARILLRLRRRGLLRSTKGPGGGYALARPASQIRVGEILEVFDTAREFRTQCLLGPGPCSKAQRCALHEWWTTFRDRFSARIVSLTLIDVAGLPAGRRKMLAPGAPASRESGHKRKAAAPLQRRRAPRAGAAGGSRRRHGG